MSLDPYDMQHTQAMLYMKLKLVYSLFGLILGLVSMLAGSVLFLHGVSGSTSWSAEVLGLRSNITDAAPGSILFIVGLFMVWVTKYKVVTNYFPITREPLQPALRSTIAASITPIDQASKTSVIENKISRPIKNDGPQKHPVRHNSEKRTRQQQQQPSGGGIQNQQQQD